MNCCGFEKNLTSRFLSEGEDPFELSSEFNFSEWYDILISIVKQGGRTPLIHTPKSYIFDYRNLVDNDGADIDELIATLPNQECFARLDLASAKPKKPYRSAKEILESFKSSDRCSPYLGQKVIIREYKTLGGGEFRCYIHEKTFRAISSERRLPSNVIDEVKAIVEKITFYTDYTSYCVDFTFDHDEEDKLMLIEINSPVWLYATSGLYDLDEGYDYSVLLGEYQPELIHYPVIRIQEEQESSPNF
jgi:hypothetical protein